MNERDRNRFEMLKRVAKFRTDNLTLFPLAPAAVPDMKAAGLFTAVDTAKAAVQAALEAREGASAGFHSGTTAQSTQRDGLMLDLLELNRAAAAIAEADGNPALMDFFRMPHGVADTLLVARARAMKTKAAGMAARFTELGFAAMKQLDVICRQKFKSNAQKLGEWAGASHIERVSSSGEVEPTPAPPVEPTP